MNSGEHILSEYSRLVRENKAMKRSYRTLMVVLLIIIGALITILMVFAPKDADGALRGRGAALLKPASTNKLRRASGRPSSPPAKASAPAKTNTLRGREVASRQAHNLKVAGSTPAPANMSPTRRGGQDLKPAPATPAVSKSSRADGLGQRTPAGLSMPPGSIYQQGLELIDLREGNYGTNPRCAKGIIGPDGEEGRFQITPIFIEDCWRLFKVRLDPYDVDACRKYIPLWLEHYKPEATSVDELYRCYQFGPTGAMR